MSISSISYLAILLLAPLLMVSKSLTLRRYAFLCLSLSVVAIANRWSYSFMYTLIWVLIPFLLKPHLKRKGILLGFMLIGYLYLNKYTWLFPFVNPSLAPLFQIFGLSYIVFRQIDYLYASEMEPSVVDYLNYTLSFYTLISGPIQRYSEFIASMRCPLPDLKGSDLLKQAHRIVNGFLKIYLISALIHGYSMQVFDRINGNFGFFLGFSALNVLYIYFNFSGYCDIVIGFARCANLSIPENFNRPYLAQNINDFWGRQHITLTRWITDYIFTPLVTALNRVKWLHFEQAQVISFFITFLLAGLWHGPSVNYLVYGLLQGIGVTLSQLYLSLLRKRLRSRKAVRIYRSQPRVKSIERGVTQLYIMVSFSFIGVDMIGKLGGLG